MASIRNEYAELGVDEYYKQHADNYENPHEQIIKKLLVKPTYGKSVIDLCCGNGLVTSTIEDSVESIIGVDPYMTNQYERETGRQCLPYDFKQLAQNIVLPTCDTIVCSFALHLCPESLLNQVLYNLTLSTNQLVIITPNKKPEIKNFWELSEEIVEDRVRLRIYERKV